MVYMTNALKYIHTALTEAVYKSKFEPQKDIPYLALMGG